MHNLKEIRKDFDIFEKSLKKRSIDIDNLSDFKLVEFFGKNEKKL